MRVGVGVELLREEAHLGLLLRRDGARGELLRRLLGHALLVRLRLRVRVRVRVGVRVRVRVRLGVRASSPPDLASSFFALMWLGLG